MQKQLILIAAFLLSVATATWAQTDADVKTTKPAKSIQKTEKNTHAETQSDGAAFSGKGKGGDKDQVEKRKKHPKGKHKNKHGKKGKNKHKHNGENHDDNDEHGKFDKKNSGPDRKRSGETKRKPANEPDGDNNKSSVPAKDRPIKEAKPKN